MPAQETDATPARSFSRQITPDGRNSLKEHLFGKGKEPITRQWYSRVVKPETLPLFLIIGAGCAFAAGFAFRHLSQNPAVQVSKKSRAQSVRENFDEGKNWIKHRESIKSVGPKYIKLEADREAEKNK